MKKLLVILMAGVTLGSFGAEYLIGKALIDSRNAGWTDSTAPYTDSNGGIWRFGLAPKGGTEPVQAMPTTYNNGNGVGYANQLNVGDVPYMIANADSKLQEIEGSKLNQYDFGVHPANHDNVNCCPVFELTVPSGGEYTLRLVAYDYGYGPANFADGITVFIYINGVKKFERLVSYEQNKVLLNENLDFTLEADDKFVLVIDPNDRYEYDTTGMEFRLVQNSAVADKATAYTLKHSEMTDGMIDERIMKVINNHYMAIDADTRWVDHFANRTACPAFFINAGEKQRYEGFGKYIDAGALFSAYSEDIAVVEKTKGLLAALRETRDEDGYIGFWEKAEDNHQEWMNWTVHDQEYILLAQLRCYLVFGDTEALEDAKIMAQYLMDNFPSAENGIEGMKIGDLTVSASNISSAGLPEAFLVLYDITREQKYLSYAANIKHGNNATEIKFDSLLNWKQNITTDGSDGRCHVYVMTARNYAQTELYREMGVDSLLTMSDREYTELFKRDGGGLLITGSSSEGEFFSYTQNGTGHIEESCVTSYLMRWLDSLMRLNGDFSIGDVLERTMYNALFAANSADGRRIRYFTCFEGVREWDTHDDGFCCCGNFRRAIAELPQKVAYQTADGTLVINLYTPLDTTFEVGEKSMALKVETDYPNSGVIDFTIGSATDIPLGLRIPRWCTDATYAINGGEAVSANRDENGLCTIERDWQAGDKVRLSLPMKWRLVRGTKNQEGYVALMRGPQLFCLGTAKNAALGAYLNKELMIDVESIGEIATDTATRSNGMMVTADAYTALDGEASSKVQVTFTEFADESGVTTYFRPYFTSGVSPIAIVYDELLDEGPAPAPTVDGDMISGYQEKYDASQTLTFTAPKTGVYSFGVTTRDLFRANGTEGDEFASCSVNGEKVIHWAYNGTGRLTKTFARYLEAGDTVRCTLIGGETPVLDATVTFRAYLMYGVKDDSEGVVDFSELYYDYIHDGGTTLPQTFDTKFGAVTLSAGTSRDRVVVGDSAVNVPSAYENSPYRGFSINAANDVPWVLVNDSDAVGPAYALAGISEPLMPHEMLMHPGPDVDTYLKATVPADGFYEIVMIIRKVNVGGDGVNGYIEIARPDDTDGKMTLAAQGYADGGAGLKIISSSPVYLTTDDAVSFALNRNQSHGSDSTGVFMYLVKRPTFPGKMIIGGDFDGKQPSDGEPVTYTGTGFTDLTDGTFWNSIRQTEFAVSEFEQSNLKNALGNETGVSVSFKALDNDRDGHSTIGFDNNAGAVQNTDLVNDYMYLYKQHVQMTFSGLRSSGSYDVYLFCSKDNNTELTIGDVVKDNHKGDAVAFKDVAGVNVLSIKSIRPDADGKIVCTLYGFDNPAVIGGFQLVGDFADHGLSIIVR